MMSNPLVNVANLRAIIEGVSQCLMMSLAQTQSGNSKGDFRAFQTSNSGYLFSFFVSHLFSLIQCISELAPCRSARVIAS